MTTPQLPITIFSKTLNTLTAAEKRLVRPLLSDYLKKVMRHFLGTAAEPLEAILERLSIDYEEWGAVNLVELIKQTWLATASADLTLREAVKAAEAQLKGRRSSEVSNLLKFEAVLQEHPAFEAAYRNAQLSAFARLTNLSERRTKQLLEKDWEPSTLNAYQLRQLEEEGVLTSRQRKSMGVLIDLHQLVGANIPLMEAVFSARKESATDWVGFEAADWLAIIEEEDLDLPVGEQSAVAYAENIRTSFERSFPSKYFFKRIRKNNYTEDTQRLNSVQALARRNPDLIKEELVDMQAIDWEGISNTKRRQIEEDLPKLTAFVNRYRRLGLEEIINDSSSDLNAKKAQINDRLQLLGRFMDNNPDFDLELTNLATVNEDLQWTDIPEDDRPAIKSQLRAYQRVKALTDSYDLSEQLLNSGLDSAFAIANLPEDDFLKRSGLDWKTGRVLYKRAKEEAAATAHAMTAMSEMAKGGFRNIGMNNLGVTANDLMEVDGWADLFGEQDFCKCEHCRSIYSPAAYFTDLMHFTEKYVSKRARSKYTKDVFSEHPLNLKNRRPDLWTLQLTCENSNTQIPYLQVVNEVLEAYLQQADAVPDIFSTLSSAKQSMLLPFNLPLQSLRLYLHHFGWKLHEVYDLLQVPKMERDRERLKISKEELEIIVTPDNENVLDYFGYPNLNNPKVKELLPLLQITRQELDELLNSRFLPEIGELSIARIESVADIQQFWEILEGLTRMRLDLIHRFLRLWKKTSWSIPELDLILVSLKAAGLLDDLDVMPGERNRLIPHLSDLVRLEEKLGLNVEDLCVLLGDFPGRSLSNSAPSLYERKFNQEQLFGIASTDDEGHSVFNESITITENNLASIVPPLLAGLSIKEDDLARLMESLGLDVQDSFVLDQKAISNMYRHTRIARALKISIEELIQAIGLVAEGKSLTDLEVIFKIVELINWQKSASFSMSDLQLITQELANAPFTYKNTEASLVNGLIQIKNAPEKDKTHLFSNYIGQLFTLTAEQLEKEWLTQLTPLDLSGTLVQNILADPFTDNTPTNPGAIQELLAYLHAMERWQLLFGRLDYQPADITFFIHHKEVFGISDLQQLNLEHLKLAEAYKEWINQEEDLIPALRAVLVQYQTDGHFSESSVSTIAHVRKQLPSQIERLQSLSLGSPALAAVQRLFQLADFTEKLGISGRYLPQFAATNYEELSNVAAILKDVFIAKYESETSLQEAFEPYTEQLNVLKRDALCNYILSQKETYKFSDRSDLYQFFLLDVEMSGCFRTSRVVSAISSVQLYLHRVLVNLEQSAAHLNPQIPDIKINPTWVPREEWDWRKNYRVWEANRKVFLYPENYIEPDLRDTKTHLFEELENELLQQKISMPEAEGAYKKYFAQFAELSRLQYAGAYYHRVAAESEAILELPNPNSSQQSFYRAAQIGVLGSSGPGGHVQLESYYYFFAHTNTDPYQYYYRIYHANKKIWGNWIKMEVAIEADEVSALIFRGRLYVFWNEVTHKEVNELDKGSYSRGGVSFTTYLKYAFQDEKGIWSPPQRLKVGTGFANEELIFRRVNSNYSALSDQDKERLWESYQEDFIQKVFNKPYAFLSGEQATPIHVSQMWSIRKHDKVSGYLVAVSFEMDGISYEGKDKFHEEFIIHNNDFTNATKKVKIKRAIGDNGVYLDGTIYLRNADKAEIIVHINSNTSVLHSLGIANKQSFDEILSTKTIPLSLSQNKFEGISNNDLFDIKYDQAIDHNHFLYDEYILVTEKNDYSRHVEDGTKNFTLHKRVITQAKGEDASLSTTTNKGYIHNVRLSTILTEELQDILHANGLDAFLALEPQTLTKAINIVMMAKLNMSGPYGAYYWELFFHIPFVIANHLNKNQRYKEAKWWYERIFNPTSPEDPGDKNPTDHNWRFREFRGLDKQKLKELLTDNEAIEAYKKDPFDPHAIARLRIAAYQKTIVMKYIDNLLDWGDYLFAQDSREAIHEAEMLYILAADILGDRPYQQGKCKTASDHQLTYENLKNRMDKGSEFLLTLENLRFHMIKDKEHFIDPLDNHIGSYVEIGETIGGKRQIHLADLIKRANHTRLDKPVFATADATFSLTVNQARPIIRYKDTAIKAQAGKHEAFEVITDDKAQIQLNDVKPIEPYIIVRDTLVFCVPENKDLLHYWDRVADRLFKIRHCMNISGVRRSLALFQPPIDSSLLVRARAAGLTIDDILRLINESKTLPVYRFTYLLEKARQFAQTVQSFGNALLSALEKKDAEELILLRSLHEQNILSLTTQIKEKQVLEAHRQILSLQATKEGIEKRVSYYNALIDEGLNDAEVTQQVSGYVATISRSISSIFFGSGSILALLPQVGSPFALTYGGTQHSDNASKWGEFLNKIASVADDISRSAGLEASFQRREQEWKHQLDLSNNDLRKIDHDILAAEIREQSSKRDLEIHERQIAQMEELDQFYKDKFTGLGLYNYMTTTLTRLYRQAYNMAQAMANTAERAYNFEINTEKSLETFIGYDNWQLDKAGLLAGEKLLLQLQQMEQSYLEKNVRQIEITQSFSMRQIDPLKLLQLRTTGKCEGFTIPEAAFDLVYPYYYKRLIKTIRISIPSIVGPYTNVGCTVTLAGSQVREVDEVPSNDGLTSYPFGEQDLIATSTAQQDSGVFELNFRGERFLPFERKGAISTWNLELPTMVRSFDYNTISDVIFHISYTAKRSTNLDFKDWVDENLAQKINSLAGQEVLQFFNLKHDFPSEWHKLLHPVNPEDGNVLNLQLSRNLFSYRDISHVLKITSITVIAKCSDSGDYNIRFHSSSSASSTGSVEMTLSPKAEYANAHFDTRNTSSEGILFDFIADTVLSLAVTSPSGNNLMKDELQDMFLIMGYQWGDGA